MVGVEGIRNGSRSIPADIPQVYLPVCQGPLIPANEMYELKILAALAPLSVRTYVAK